MKNLLRISLLVLIALFLFPDDASAQFRKKKKKKKKPKTEQRVEKSSKDDSAFNGLQDRLWYGTGGTLNFGGNQFGNEFTIGLTPMAGYKVTPWLSAGPRVEISYNTGRYDIGLNNVIGFNNTDFGGGVFVRAKSPFGLYLHSEYFLLNDQCLSDGTPESGGICQIENPTRYQGLYLNPADQSKFLSKRITRDAFFVGLGYNSQNGFSKWGYEIQLNYDLLAPDNTTTLPFDIRFGLTYNF